MANIEELHDKIVSNQLTDDDKFKLQNILEHVSRQREIKSINSKKYYERIKDNDEIMNKIRKQKNGILYKQPRYNKRKGSHKIQ